jgi:hypothetical protein
VGKRTQPGAGSELTAKELAVRVVSIVCGAILIVVCGFVAFSVVGYAFTTDDDLGRRVADGNGYEAILGAVAVLGMGVLFGYSLINWRWATDRGAKNMRAREAAGIAARAGSPVAAPMESPALAAGAPVDNPVVSPLVRAPRSPRAGVIVLILALLMGVAIGIAVANQLGWLLLLVGLPQIALGIVGAVLARTALPQDRRPYRIAGWVTGVLNAGTMLLLGAVISWVTG